MLIRLQKNDFKMINTPGKFMFAADALSRAVDKNERADDKTSADILAYVNTIVTSMPVADDRMECIRQATELDDTMEKLKQAILTGWPAQKHDCPRQIQDYLACRGELSVVGGIVFQGSNFVIPVALRKEMLGKIHEGHLGEEKCKRRTHEVMYWPRMNQDISQTTASCEICLTYSPRQKALMPHTVPDRPVYNVGVDFFDCNGKSQIVLTDYFSNYPEVATLQSTTNKAVITFMKATFARHGVLCEVVSDNGPQVSSGEFASFAKEWGFLHITPSPHYPKSNGLAESSVKVVKNLMKKSAGWA